MSETDNYLNYRKNTNGTITVLIKGKEAGTFADIQAASGSVDTLISDRLKDLAEKVGIGKEVAKIIDE